MRFLTLLLTLLLVFSLVACGGSSNDESKPAFSNDNSAPQEESKPESKPESSVPESSANTSTDASTDASTDSSDVSGEEPGEDFEPFEAIDYGKVEIKKATGEIKIDGKVSDGEYATVFEYDANSPIWNSASTETAELYEPKLYIAWDDEYLYTAVTLIPGSPRTYDNDDFASVRPYIFDRRHLMSAIILGDPTDSKYLPSDGSNAMGWEEAYLTGYSTEWTVTAQPDGTKIQADHFGELTSGPFKANWKYELSSGAYDVEVYEQAIPWKALSGGLNFEATAGTIIGYAFSAACEEVDYEVEEGEDTGAIYAGFGTGILNGKNFAHYVGLTLAE